MTLHAAGLCPECSKYLMIVVEPMTDDAWAWKCHHCETLFLTPTVYDEAHRITELIVELYVTDGDDPESPGHTGEGTGDLS